MFKWYHESSIEVNAPLRKVWEVYCNPDNLTKWSDEVESCHMEGEHKAGSIIKVKVKNRKAFLSILVKEVKPYEEVKSLIRTFFVAEETASIFQEVSPERTRLIIKTCIISLFVPFMRSILFKQVEKSIPKLLKVLEEAGFYAALDGEGRKSV